ncbi:MAG: hypothetical protein IKS78_04955 [Clostridia bacterium]|nr:hypothetical protein [Clostridia bacterium]
MAKKNFTASPLMNFITPAAPEPPEDSPAKAAEGQGNAAGRDVHSTDTPETKAAPEATAPADQTAAPERRQRKPAQDAAEAEERARIAAHNARFKSAPPTPPEYFAKPDTEETRSRRVQLLVKPSIYKRIRGIAHWQKQSVNNLFEEILTEYIESRDERGRRK